MTTTVAGGEAMINRWELLDRIEELERASLLSHVESIGLITEVNVASYNNDYEWFNRIERLLTERGDSHV